MRLDPIERRVASRPISAARDAVMRCMPRSQSLRFLIAGASATAINLMSRSLLSIALRFDIAVACAYAIGMVFGFVVYRNWVFRGSQLRLPHQLMLFSVVNVAGLAIVVLVAKAALMVIDSASFVSVRPAEAMAHGLALIAAAVANFAGHRSLSFAQKPWSGSTPARA